MPDYPLTIHCDSEDQQAAFASVIEAAKETIKSGEPFVSLTFTCGTQAEADAYAKVLGGRGRNWPRRFFTELLHPGADETMRVQVLESVADYFKRVENGQEPKATPAIIAHRIHKALENGSGRGLIRLVAAVDLLMASDNPQEYEVAVAAISLAMGEIRGVKAATAQAAEAPEVAQ